MNSILEKVTTKKSLYSVYVLVIANLIPLFGVLFLGWNLLHIMLIYWTESAIVGFYNVIRMLVINPAKSTFLVPFFCFHFGMFMFVHLIFIATLTSFPGILTGSPPKSGFLLNIESIKNLLLPVAALFISHSISLFTNFFKREEYKKRTIQQQMFIPYRRIIVMHLTLIFGAFIIIPTGQPMLLIALMTIIKTILDVMAHLHEHSAKATPLTNNFQFSK